jgi:2,4-dienoyl-CoA reductase (NADPH2)
MSYHKPFNYKTSDELLQASEDLGYRLPFSKDISSLFKKISISGTQVPNRLAVQPMEGFDAYQNGAPSKWTERRYLRYAEGGSGLIWFEATAVTDDSRSNPHQLYISNGNIGSFKTLVAKVRSAAAEKFGTSHRIYCVLQLTHSGRYSRPVKGYKPKVVNFNPFLNKDSQDLEVISDKELDSLQDDFLEAAHLAFHAGFDAVDIKSCHGYLLNELLGAYTRKNSRYGGGFENRSRFLTEVVQKIRSAIGGLGVSSRINVFDGIPFPYGFGFARESSPDIDLIEIKVLIRRLLILGCTLLNITAGHPYYKPHITRPFDRSAYGTPMPEEDPLEGVIRLIRTVSNLQEEFPEVLFVGTGYSWLRQFFPYVGAAVIKKKRASFIGLGRSSFAYPDAPCDLMEKGKLDKGKVCITCSRCTELMRHLVKTGCVVHDLSIYGEEYKKMRRALNRPESKE